ncbi:hypothetical protein [Caballeronia sp. S22]|uniref:hypothetical protein n=1 Tax=Caballeronia sp. S22 TaxID=3137182 RepID=UPI0035317949
MTEVENEQIEHLLLENYRWQIRQSHAATLAHFYRPADRTCRGYETPAGEDDEDDGYGWADDRQAEEVQMCIDALPLEQRAAVSTTMRNKECGRQVWSSMRAGDQHVAYQAAKQRLMPMFASRGLMQTIRAVASEHQIMET